MRPKIMPSHSISDTLRYNERKVTEKQAECILAVNFLKDIDRLTFDDKLQRFERRMQLNEDVVTNQHITLNFDPLDQLSNEKMRQIAQIYMKEIGFEHQPYIVYRHHDSGHPHCHVVTTHVQRNGEPIVMYNMGRNQSEKARQHIEAEFDLMTKEKKQELRRQSQKVGGVPMVMYGERSTARAVSDVLEYVVPTYKYTNLEELNAVLRLYNVEAYRGKENTKLHQNRGLLYRVLDEHGKYIGVPLKASFFDCKPTLARLEERFAHNLELKQQHRDHVQTYVRWHLFQEPNSLEELSDRLGREGIGMVCPLDKNNNIKSLAFVDFKNRCVFRAEELGEECSRRAVQEMIVREQTQTQELQHSQRQRHRLRL